jgi:hypothetical protein
VLDGPAGPKPVTGLAFAKALSLPSTLFTTREGVAATAPKPPSGLSILQAPPEEAPAIAAASVEVSSVDITAVDPNALIPSLPGGRSVMPARDAEDGPGGVRGGPPAMALLLVLVVGPLAVARVRSRVRRPTPTP